MPTRRRMSIAAITAVLLMLVASGGAAWATHTVVRDQERRLLNERAAEIALIFTTAVSNLSSSMTSFTAVLRATGASPTAFEKAAAGQLTPRTAKTTTIAL